MFIAMLMAVQSVVGSAGGCGADIGRDAEPAAVADWKASVGINVWSGFGEPFHDMLGPQFSAGHHLHRWLGTGWWVRADVYRTESDFENPGDAVLGTSGTPVADASISMLSACLGMEWHPWDLGDRFDVYFGAGFGFVTLGDGDARSLPTVDLEVTGNSGPMVYLMVGGAVRVAGPVYIIGEFRFAEIFAALDVRDRNSGKTGSLDSWEASGFTVGIEIRF